jgi:hypothetical protein
LHFQGFLNKNSPWAHTEVELSMLGVAGKLGKNPVHGCPKKNQIFFLFLEVAQTMNNQNLASRNFRG